MLLLRRCGISQVVFPMLFALVLPVPTFAQDSPQRDSGAVAILARSFLLMGGAQKAAIADVQVEGTLALATTPDATIGKFVTKIRGADFAIETDRNGEQTSYRVLDGNGSFRRQGKIVPLQPFNSAGLAVDFLPIFSRWTEFTDPRANVKGAEQAGFGGVPCDQVRVELVELEDRSKSPLFQNGHDTFDLCFESGSGLPAALRYQASQGPQSGDQVEIENHFAKYQAFDGILLPTQIIRHIAGRPVLALRITSVQFNNGFSHADFQF